MKNKIINFYSKNIVNIHRVVTILGIITGVLFIITSDENNVINNIWLYIFLMSDIIWGLHYKYFGNRLI